MLEAWPVQGRFRSLRWGANAILIAILVGIPWVRIAGEPLVLLDIPARRFHVFGLVIFPQELFFLWLILAALAVALFFFTALAGRLWCGWACPQTVFTDLFAAIARQVEGWKGRARPARVALWRRVLVHGIWLVLCAGVAFHLVAYFRSPYETLAQLRDGSLSATVAGFLLVFTAITYLDFVVVRQTFCKFLCPYARFQGVLFDRDTLVVGYDERRGEPRGKAGRVEGDCVDCGLCVKVCPTGIDIREGMQLECIACTQCIDACDGVMARLGRRRGLIDYRSLRGLEGGAGRLVRVRTVAYGTALVALFVAFGVLLAQRLPMDLHVAHNRSQLSTRVADGRLGNAFTLHITNRDRSDHSYRIRLGDENAYELVAGVNPIPVPAASAAETRVFVLADPARGGADPIRFVLEEVGREERRVERVTPFVNPGRVEGHDG